MKALHSFGAIALILSACSDDANVTSDARPPMIDAAATPPKTFKQIEVLARPGIAEALLLSNGFLAAYNATGPTFAGVDPAAVAMVKAEAKTVLKAVYLGACLLNGIVDPTGVANVKPGGLTCVEIGGNIFMENSLAGVTLKATVAAQAEAYAERIFNQFVPDVMRVDMNVTLVNNYETLCGDPAMPLPLLCGGRYLDDDTIDVTYDYLINGAGLGGASGDSAAAYNQVNALVSDGVQFSRTTGNRNTRTRPVSNNQAQHHAGLNDPQLNRPVSGTFPFSAAPL